MTQWKFFKKAEFKCKCGCGIDNIDEDFLDLLDEARFIAGIPFVINSGCRCESHNRYVRGSANSSHIATEEKPSCAVDIKAVNSRERLLIVRALISVGIHRIGVADTFVHADNDESKPPSVMWTY